MTSVSFVPASFPCSMNIFFHFGSKQFQYVKMGSGKKKVWRKCHYCDIWKALCNQKALLLRSGLVWVGDHWQSWIYIWFWETSATLVRWYFLWVCQGLEGFLWFEFILTMKQNNICEFICGGVWCAIILFSRPLQISAIILVVRSAFRNWNRKSVKATTRNYLEDLVLMAPVDKRSMNTTILIF